MRHADAAALLAPLLALAAACSDNAVVAQRDAGPKCTPSGATELACSDGVDDDCDGQTDCLDPDCNGQSLRQRRRVPVHGGRLRAPGRSPGLAAGRRRSRHRARRHRAGRVRRDGRREGLPHLPVPERRRRAGRAGRRADDPQRRSTAAPATRRSASARTTWRRASTFSLGMENATPDVSLAGYRRKTADAVLGLRLPHARGGPAAGLPPRGSERDRRLLQRRLPAAVHQRLQRGRVRRRGGGARSADRRRLSRRRHRVLRRRHRRAARLPQVVRRRLAGRADGVLHRRRGGDGARRRRGRFREGLRRALPGPGDAGGRQRAADARPLQLRQHVRRAGGRRRELPAHHVPGQPADPLAGLVGADRARRRW